MLVMLLSVELLPNLEADLSETKTRMMLTRFQDYETILKSVPLWVSFGLFPRAKDKVRQLAIMNRIGLSDLKSNHDFRHPLTSDLKSNDEIGFQLKAN